MGEGRAENFTAMSEIADVQTAVITPSPSGSSSSLAARPVHDLRALQGREPVAYEIVGLAELIVIQAVGDTIPALQRLRDPLLVREKGSPLPIDEIVESDLILPEPDLTLEEAQVLFVGEGLLPG